MTRNTEMLPGRVGTQISASRRSTGAFRFLAAALTATLLAAQPASATLVNYYTFDNASNLGEDSVGTRDLTQVDLGSGAGTVAQIASVADGFGLTHSNVLRTAGTTFSGLDTADGTYFTDDLGVSNTLAQFTVSLWGRTDVADLPGFNGVFSNDNSNNLQIDRGDNGINPDRIRLNGQSGIVISGDDVGEKGFDVNDWIHMAVTYDGASTRLYVEGDLIGTVAGNPGNQFQAINVGSNRAESRLHDGDLDEIGIFDRALDDAAVMSVVSLFEEPALNYELAEVEQLLQAFNSSAPSVTIDGVVWKLVDDGSLTSTPGQVVAGQVSGFPVFSIALDGSGNGFATPLVPEPSSFLLLAGGIGLLARRRRR